MSTPHRTVIKVMGLGGGGSNAVNRMIETGIEGVDFIAANTDAQALAQSLAPCKIQLGPQLTRGLGSGGNPECGEAAAKESALAIKAALTGADMLFLTAGMGGGTGTGAIAIAATIARAMGILTVAVVTTPFTFEASIRQRHAQAGLAKLRPQADTLITVANDKLLQLVPQATFEMSLRVADEVLRQGVQGIAELINKPGLINVDFANIRALMKRSGGAMLAIGQGRGPNKASEAMHQALKMPLLDLSAISAATGLLLHFTGAEDLSLFEVSEAVNQATQAAPQAEVVMGATIDPLMQGRTQVILVVTGLDGQPAPVVAAPVPVVRPAPQPRPAPVPMPVPAEPVGHLAEALFQHALTDTSLAEPEACLTIRVPAPDPNNLDLPAFLRRRKTLRDFSQR